VSLGAWWRRRRREREARRLLCEALRSPELLRGTSLRPSHAARCVLLEHEERDGRIRRIRFGILRHPRPYAFSRQHHQVVEVYLYDVEGGRISRLEGWNVTRSRGLDAGD
jgi:hypothetical protein